LADTKIIGIKWGSYSDTVPYFCDIMPNKDLFSEFPSITKADWIKKITKDLKDKPLGDLDWNISDDLRISPLVHAEDFEAPQQPISLPDSGWEICEAILVSAPVKANAQALEALIGGTEGLTFVFETAPDWAAFEQTLAGVHLDFIGLHFAGQGVRENPAGIFGHLLRLAKIRNIDTRSLHGSTEYDPVQTGGIIDWRYLVDLLELAQTSFPHVKVISLDFSKDENPAVALAETLKKANEYFSKLSARGFSVEHAASFIQFSMPIGKSYFLEIAKIRAFKLLWVNVLKSWNAAPVYPSIAAHCQATTYTDDLYTNMIRATTIAMSAVLGGADRLTVLPYDSNREDMATYPPAFGRRIARNVQHLMKMESGLDLVNDPAAGSYYIEKLTILLAEKAWEALGVSAKQ